MHLFTQTLNGFSGQVADLSIGLNTDIFEANLVNLVLLTGGVFYLGSNALSESLVERQQKILGAIQESEERLQVESFQPGRMEGDWHALWIQEAKTEDSLGEASHRT